MNGENSSACVSCSASTHCSIRVRALDTTTNWSPVAAIARGRTCCTFLRMGKPRLAPGEPPSPPLPPAAVHTCAHAVPRRRPTPSANVWYPAGACASSHVKWTTHVTCAVLRCAVLCSSRIGARSCVLVQRHCSISVPEQLLEEELLACFE